MIYDKFKLGELIQSKTVKTRSFYIRGIQYNDDREIIFWDTPDKSNWNAEGTKIVSTDAEHCVADVYSYC